MSSLQDSLNNAFSGIGIFIENENLGDFVILDNITINMEKDNQVGIMQVDGGILQIGTTNASLIKINPHGNTPIASVILGQHPGWQGGSGSVHATTTLKIIGSFQANGNIQIYNTGHLQLGDDDHAGYLKGYVNLLEGSKGLDIYNDGVIPDIQYEKYAFMDDDLSGGSMVDGNVLNDGQNIRLHHTQSSVGTIITGNVQNNGLIDFGSSADNYLYIGGDLSGDGSMNMRINPQKDIHDKIQVKGNITGTHHINVEFITPDNNFFSAYLLKGSGNSDATMTLDHDSSGAFELSILQSNITLFAKDDHQKTIQLKKSDVFLATLETNDNHDLCVTYKGTFFCNEKGNIDSFIDLNKVIIDGKGVLSKVFFMPLFINPYLSTVLSRVSLWNFKTITTRINIDRGFMQGSPWLSSDFSYYKTEGFVSVPMYVHSKWKELAYVQIHFINESNGFLKDSFQSTLGTHLIWYVWHALQVNTDVHIGWIGTNVNLPSGEDIKSYSKSLNSLLGGGELGIGYPLWKTSWFTLLGQYNVQYDYIAESHAYIDDLKALSSNTTVTIEGTHLFKNILNATISFPYGFSFIGEVGDTLGHVTMDIPPQAKESFSLNGAFYQTGIQWGYKGLSFNVQYSQSLYQQRIALGIGGRF